MFVPGEQVQELFEVETDKYLICAPFIKKQALKAILKNIPDRQEIRVDIYTRWNAHEVAAGVSDLEVFDICAERQNTGLSLVEGLHAKLFLAGDECLVGSANVTDTAFGWIYPSNIELLVRVPTSDPSVAQLLRRLQQFSEEATSSIRIQVANEAAAIQAISLPDARESDTESRDITRWLPNCIKPELVYRAYRSKQLTGEIEATRQAAYDDLRFLNPPIGLNREQFSVFIQHALRSMPLFEELLRLVERDELVNGIGRDLINQMYGDERTTRPGEAFWPNVREWLMHFFGLRAEPHDYRIVAGSKSNANTR